MFPVLLVAAALAVAAPPVELPTVDAFLSSNVDRALKVEALAPPLRDLVSTGRVSGVEKRLGVPTFFWPALQQGASLRDLRLTPEQAARRYLFTYAPLYRFDSDVLASARLSRLHDLGQGAIVAQFEKDLNGIKVFRDELKVVMNQRLELVAVSGYLTPARRVLGSFQLAPETAVGVAYGDLTGKPLEGGALKPLSADGAGFGRYALTGEGTPVRVRKVYFPLPSGLTPAFHVELKVDRAYYSYVVSANDGTLLFRHNLTQHDFSYRVWADNTTLHMPLDGPAGDDPSPHPTGMPDHYNPPFIAPSLMTLAHGPISTNDPWLDPNATTTDGNNTRAYADLNAPDGFSSGDIMPDVTATGVFDRVYDVNVSPGTTPDQTKAAVTQLFYDVNFFHDWYYDVGFDEKAGNAQKSNLGRGGVEGDPLLAEGQDYSGRNNSDMSTPSDGASPRMQMYIFDGGIPAWLTLTGQMPLTVGVADFGSQLFDLTGELVLVNDNDTSGMNGTVTDACTATGWTTSVQGKIAVVDRGQCTFVVKAENAQANGALGVLILNNAGGGAIPLPGSSSTAMIPVLSLGRADGNALKMKLMQGTVTAEMKRVAVIDRDGTIDNAIVAHEWGHYIQNRLVGDGNGLTNYQASGMAEGWSDFHAMLMVVKGEDALRAANANFSGAYALAGYTMYGVDTNAWYWGIRRAPYSTDMTKNPFTFKHIQEGVALPTTAPLSFGQDGNGNSEVHATGEVWAEMLWECYATLLRDTQRLTFDQARDRMRAYLVAAYKLTPLMPTFVEARDAMLAAAMAADPTDFALFYGAFAKRGNGMGAVAPDRDSSDNTPVTESFLVGNELQVVKVTLDDSVMSCDNDGNLDVGETGKLTVTVKNVGVGLLAQITGTVSTPMTGVRVLGGGALNFSPLAPFGTAVASVQVALDSAAGNSQVPFNIALNEPTLLNPGPRTSSPQFRVNFDAKPTGSYTDDVEAPMTAWTFSDDPNGATGSDFRRFEDSATSHWFYGPDADSPADTYLISPTLKVGTGPFTFTFSHRYQFEKDAMYFYDGAVVEISVGGGAYTDIGSHLSQPYTGKLDNRGSNPIGGRMAYAGTSDNYPAWSTVTVDLGTMYAGQDVRIRFRIGADDAVGLKGWELDNFAFVGLTEGPFASVTTDPNSCTNHPPTVVQPDLRYVDEDTHVVLSAMATDPDGDATTVAFTQIAGPLLTMSNNAFDAPEVMQDTEVDFQVVASDGRAVSAPVTARVIIRNVNKPPVASVMPADQTVDEGSPVTITGSATDPENDPIAAWKWTQVSGTPVMLMGDTTSTLTFAAPQVNADTVLTFQLVANDGTSDSAPVTATVTVHDDGNNVGSPAHPKCGCGATDSTATVWLAAALAMAMVMARKRRR
jgi:hypothetical protein